MKNYKALLKKHWVLTVFVLVLGVMVFKSASPGDGLSAPTAYDYDDYDSFAVMDVGEGSFAYEETMTESRAIVYSDDASLEEQDDSKIIKTGSLIFM